ncbi:alpha/beta hydrolase family protein [Gimesia aquarii]|uniref:Thermostable monoacylglycerol lipase n=1 Tax=Gimesia aquarii TaxID=2527964 RepID=A0A517WRN2_9PLAN|nr:prolyl oligopeptidase family serine peptidase [Gimesia aquarii]QDU07878.1 Thermostable monoacylglycerol lipase [Gimesia aquarii]
MIQKQSSDQSTRPKTKLKKVIPEENFFEDESNSSIDMFNDDFEDWEDDLSGGSVVKPGAKKKNKTPKKKKKSPSDYSLKKYGLTPFIAVTSIGLILLNLFLFLMQSHFLMLAFMLTCIVAIGYVFAGGLGLLIEAGKESGTELILCLIVPLYNVYFAISRIEQTKQSLATFVTGAFLLLISFTLTFGSLISISSSRSPSFTAPDAAEFNETSQSSPTSISDINSQLSSDSRGQFPKTRQPNSPTRSSNQTQRSKFDLSQIKPMLMSWPAEGASGFSVYRERKTASIGKVYEAQNSRSFEGESPAGANMKFRVYLPPDINPASPVPCILVPPAGSNLLTGMEIDPPDLIPNPEHEPYLKAGFAVITFSLDGHLWRREQSTNFEVKNAHSDFRKSKAGLVNCVHAFLETQAVIPGIDKNNVFIAGHSSAGTLSLLFAEHYPQIKGCLAYAASVDLKKSMAEYLPTIKAVIPDVEDFLRLSSPQSHISNLTCPVFIFHSREDPVTSFTNSQNFASQLKTQGTEVEFVAGNGNDHYQTMIDEGLPKGIEWIKKQIAKSSSSQTDTQMAASKGQNQTALQNAKNLIDVTRRKATFKVNGFDEFYEKTLKEKPDFWKSSIVDKIQLGLGEIVPGHARGSANLNLEQMTLSFEFTGDLPSDIPQKFADNIFAKSIILAEEAPKIEEASSNPNSRIMDSNYLTFRIRTLNRLRFNKNSSPKVAEVNLQQINRYVPNSLIINYADKWIYIKLKGLGDKSEVERAAVNAFSTAGLFVSPKKFDLSPADLAMHRASNSPNTASGKRTTEKTSTNDPQSDKKQKYVIHYGVYSGKSIKESVKRSLKGFVWVDQKSIQFNPDAKEISFINRSPVDDGALERALTRNKFYQLNITKEAIPEVEPTPKKEETKAGT